MFAHNTAITFYQTVGANEWLVSIHVANVKPTNPIEVHALYAFHMMIKYHLDQAARESEITWVGDK